MGDAELVGEADDHSLLLERRSIFLSDRDVLRVMGKLRFSASG
jgi:hypothetical protein